MLDDFRVKGLEQASIHVCVSFTVMLAIALAAVRSQQPGLMRRIKHFTA